MARAPKSAKSPQSPFRRALGPVSALALVGALAAPAAAAPLCPRWLPAPVAGFCDVVVGWWLPEGMILDPWGERSTAGDDGICRDPWGRGSQVQAETREHGMSIDPYGGEPPPPPPAPAAAQAADPGSGPTS